MTMENEDSLSMLKSYNMLDFWIAYGITFFNGKGQVD